MDDVFGVAFGAVIVVVVSASALFRRRGGREAQSVAGYRQTMDVLGHLGEARGIHRQGLPEAAVPVAAPHERSKAAGAGRFDDAQSSRGRSSTGVHGAPPRRRDRSLVVMERPARRLFAPLAVSVVVLAAVGGAAYVVVRGHHTTRPPAAHRPAQASAHSHSHSHSHGQTHTHSHGHSQGHTSTPSTAPASYTAVSSTSSSATYAPVTSSYSLTVGATTADCWMSVTSSSGTTVLAQTFTPGTSASVSLDGGSTILLGAPRAAKMSIDGVPVVLPKGIAGPYTVTLSPA